MSAKIELQPLALPNLAWAVGSITEILMQPGEQFYLFAVQPAKGKALFLRIADAHTGAPLRGVSSNNLIYDLLKEAYFRKLSVQVAYRDFGPDPQSGINKLCIDRVILTP